MEAYLLSSAILIILSVFASKATGKLGIPTLVVFLAVGILAGREGLGKIHFDDAGMTQSLGIIALAYILFSGGLDTKWKSVQPIFRAGLSLSTIGVLLTALLVGTFVHYALDFSLLESFLLGAIVSSTDSGAVFTVLRSRNIHLKKHLKPLLEFESGSNDPMAVFLTTTILQMMAMPDLSVWEMIPLFFKQMLIGGLLGLGFGYFLAKLFNRIKLHVEGLYTVLSLAAVMFIYSATQKLHGNGFLAVYVAGMTMGNQTFVFKKTLGMMHDGISWLMQSVMFLTMGLLIYPGRVMAVAEPGILISLFMIFLARPASVFLSLTHSRLSLREKLLVAWVGLRGSVPIILATYPLVAGIDRAPLLFNLVFFVAVSSLIVQGTTISVISRWLGVDDPSAHPTENYSATPGHLGDIVVVDVPELSPVVGKNIVDLELPHRKVLIVAIERAGEVIIPRGSTTLEGGDKISVMADDDYLADFVELLWIPTSKKRIFHFGRNSDSPQSYS